MAHIPYGYTITDGKAVIDDCQADAVRKFFIEYVSGKSLDKAVKSAGLNIYHGSAGRILRNKHYLGDDFYPVIIEQELFDKAEKIRLSRAEKLGRTKEPKTKSEPKIYTKFRLGKAALKYTNPFSQAEYIYSLIESVANQDEKKYNLYSCCKKIRKHSK